MIMYYLAVYSRRNRLTITISLVDICAKHDNWHTIVNQTQLVVYVTTFHLLHISKDAEG